MKNKDEALKMAIEYIEMHLTTNERTFIERTATLEACKEALAHPAQEPVYQTYNDWCCSGWTDVEKWQYEEAKEENRRILYTPPAPSWQGLDIDDRNKIFNKFGVYAVPANFELFRAIEQALKEKNHGV